MVKKLFIYIFIYTLLVGCDTQNVLTNSECDSEFEYMDVTAPSLEMDGNGYYHIEWLGGYVQTFSTLTVETGLDYREVQWVSNKEINLQYFGQDNWTNLVNTSSYTDDEGVAHTVLGVWEVMITDTITVYAGYYDECDIEHIDSIKVIVDNEI